VAREGDGCGVEPAVEEVEVDARRRRRWGKWRRRRGSGGGREVEADAQGREANASEDGGEEREYPCVGDGRL
jgi:hypothetical protein